MELEKSFGGDNFAGWSSPDSVSPVSVTINSPCEKQQKLYARLQFSALSQWKSFCQVHTHTHGEAANKHMLIVLPVGVMNENNSYWQGPGEWYLVK